jgi:hypothetical protein
MILYIYVAAAVIVIVGTGLAGIMLIRRGRRHLKAAQFEEDAKDAARFEPRWETESDEITEPAATPPYFAEPGPVDAEPDYYSRGGEQLLTEWRTKEFAALSAVSQPGEESPAEPAPAIPQMAPAACEAAGCAVPPMAPALVDPLGMVVLDLLEGKGKLTPAELKRLDVFRPERIGLAAQTVQTPLYLHHDEDAALRLAQIQLYAATLEMRAKWASQMYRRGGAIVDVPLTARDFKLKIARDILDLPPSDRSEVIGFLLGGLLSSPGSSRELKRAVIDTLEQLRSVVLTNVLLDCLDDPDPIVQEFALAAADRLLQE